LDNGEGFQFYYGAQTFSFDRTAANGITRNSDMTSVTNATFVRQTELTGASNALVVLPVRGISSNGVVYAATNINFVGNPKITNVNGTISVDVTPGAAAAGSTNMDTANIGWAQFTNGWVGTNFTLFRTNNIGQSKSEYGLNASLGGNVAVGTNASLVGMENIAVGIYATNPILLAIGTRALSEANGGTNTVIINSNSAIGVGTAPSSTGGTITTKNGFTSTGGHYALSLEDGTRGYIFGVNDGMWCPQRYFTALSSPFGVVLGTNKLGNSTGTGTNALMLAVVLQGTTNRWGETTTMPELEIVGNASNRTATANLNIPNNGNLRVDGIGRFGSNMTIMTAIASPTVTGTNNGIFWASNNTLFWRWTAGGTTTNEVKIAGP
jgi:hypothetical protein